MMNLCLDRDLFPKRGRYIVEHEVNNCSEEDGHTEVVEPKTSVIDPKIKRRLLILQILKIIYILISIIVILSAVLLIGLSAVGAIVFRSYTTDNQNSRVASMIVVAMCAAVGVALGAYGNATVIRNQTGALYRISVTYVVTACALLLVAVFAVHMSAQDEDAAALALKESFRLARQHSARHTRQWQQTQFELDCCGLSGPEDYRQGTSYKYPPEVSSSCCAGYDPSLSDLLQQDMLRTCLRQNTFYRSGCQENVVRALSDASSLVYLLCIVVVTLFRQDMLRTGLRQNPLYRSGCQENVVRALSDASSLVYLLCIVVVTFFMLLGAYGLPLSRLIKNWRKTDAKQGSTNEADAAKG